jgi:REP-associated tyrosine transposase
MAVANLTDGLHRRMPRRPRGSRHDHVYHVLNRAVRRAVLFDGDWEYAAFERVLFAAMQRYDVRLLAYCAMPTHWHLVVWPDTAGQLSRLMHWMTTTHALRWHSTRRTIGTGAVYQGRFKAIPVQTDEHFLRLCRYVERNPLRAGLADRAEHWRWSSLWRRCNYCDAGILDDWPVPRPAEWLSQVNAPQTEAELEQLRTAIRKNAPLGDGVWTSATATDFGLDPRFRDKGRPTLAG